VVALMHRMRLSLMKAAHAAVSPVFPATQHRTKPHVRLSLKERRKRSANATKPHRKSG
jgi:hypothetical protein